MTRVCAQKIGGVDSGRIVPIGTEADIVGRWLPVALRLRHKMTPEICYMRELSAPDLTPLAEEFDELAERLDGGADRAAAAQVAALVRSALADGSRIEIA